MIPLSVAPMMERTDRHFRRMMRHITPHTLLYTEMVTAPAVLHGDRDKLLGFDEAEHPIALQLGGDDPEDLAACARIAEARGYDEVNLNVGCPSHRVQRGRFGASLMAHPEVVAAAVTAMREAVDIEVTVKHRIGIDDLDRYEDMAHFVEVVARAGCRRFSVHARKAWLQGLSPKENRNVPPLRYRDVHRLKRTFPHLDIEINGGITTVEATLEHLEHVDGVMIGRAAYDDPMLFAALEPAVFGERSPCPEPEDVVEAMIPYLERHNAQGGSSHHVLRHMHHLFAGRPGARAWRRLLTERAREPGGEVLRAGLAQRRDVLDRMARIRDQESAA